MDTKAAERRRKVNAVRVGSVIIGAPNPVVIQSMTTTPTLDTEASVAQTIAIAESGAQIVRLTAQGVNHAANLENISRELRSRGCDVPLVADIHFNPAAAFEAAAHVEKVRINPGNFAVPGPPVAAAWHGHTYRCKSRFSQRPYYEPFRRRC